MNTPFCTDIDLHRWEPALAVEAVPAAQTRLCGRGTLHGKRLTLDADLPIAPGAIVVITEGVAANAVHRVVEVDRAAPMVTLERFGSPVNAGGRQLVPEPAAVTFAIRTFAAQRLIVSGTLAWMSGINPQASIVLPELRRTCILGTLHLIYAGLHASAGRRDVDLLVRTELYARLYRQSLNSAAVEVDNHRRALKPVERFAHL